MENEQTANSLKVYQTAKSLLGHRLANNPQLGCAESVNYIVQEALGKPVGGGASTAEMYKALLDTTRFFQLDSGITSFDPLPGDIIISPTGQGNGRLPHGHVGIIAKYGILSNNSETGLLSEHFTLESWSDLYAGYGGYPISIFRPL